MCRYTHYYTDKFSSLSTLWSFIALGHWCLIVKTMTTSIPKVLSFTILTSDNATSCLEQEVPPISQRYEIWFWTMVAICTLIVATGTTLNSLVIYFANKKPLAGKLRHLNKVVTHLAVSDMLFSIVACPAFLVGLKMGKR